MILTYSYRIKDATTAKRLERHARAVNFVWNYCCQIQREAERKRRAGLSVKWPTWVDLDKLTRGTCTDLNIQADTVTAICRRFVQSRDQFRRCPRFRASFGPRRALGWIPFRPNSISINGDSISYRKQRYRLWLSRAIDGEIRAGSFAQDARGRWYFNIGVEVGEVSRPGNGEVGIDLGLKTLATTSEGEAIPNMRHYRRYEAALAKAQRARNKGRVRAIHAKIANSRRDHLHKVSNRLVRTNRRIVVGNVSASKLAKTNMAKSVLDAGWHSFRVMLAYKAIRHGCEYVETNEAYTTRTCSACGCTSGPKGIAGLGIRDWECCECGARHDRDVNSAKLILRFGLERQALAGEIPTP